MEKKLIFEDRVLLAEFENEASTYKTALELLKYAYEELEIGDFNNDVLKELCQSGISKAAEKYTSRLNKELDNAKVIHESLRSNLLAGTEVLISKLDSAISSLKSTQPTRKFQQSRPPLQLADISIDADGWPFISESVKERLLEQHCRTYVVGERQIQLYESLVEFENSFNQLNSELIALNVNMDGFGIDASRFNTIKAFFNLKGSSIELNPKSIPVIVNYNESKAQSFKESN